MTTKITVCQTANNTSTTAQHNVLCLLVNDHLYQARDYYQCLFWLSRSEEASKSI